MEVLPKTLWAFQKDNGSQSATAVQYTTIEATTLLFSHMDASPLRPEVEMTCTPC